MSEPPAIELADIHKRFRRQRRWIDLVTSPRGATYATALERITLTIAPTEIVGLLGVNGAGKTTLLKILSTLITPDSGTATVCGFDVVREAARVRSVLAPVTADERSLDWRLDALENLRFYGALHGLTGTALSRRIGQLLAQVELTDTEGKLVGSFSSGMRQRLLVARALLSRPRVLLLDEPTRSLDPIAARSFRSFLKTNIVAEEGCTIVLATHFTDEAFDLCDRVAVLDHGRLLALGSPSVLAADLDKPRYRVWTLTPHHPIFVGNQSGPWRFRPIDDLTTREIGVFETVLPDDRIAPADLLAALHAANARVSRFEKVQLRLADLIESVLLRQRSNDA